MKAKIQHEIQEYCRLLKLNAISEHFEEAIKGATDYEGFLHQLLRMEVDAEEARAKERKIKAAKFPYRKYIEDLERDLLPESMSKRLPELCSLEFIREGKNIIILGDPKHPEVQGIRGWCLDEPLIYRNEEEILANPPSKDKNYTLVAQTTFDQYKFKKILELFEKMEYNLYMCPTI